MPETLLSGFSRSAVEELSRRKGEPAWMLEKRLRAWETYEKTPAPLGNRSDLGTLRTFSNFKFQALQPYVPANGNGSLPAPITQSLEQALVDQRAGLIVQRNASVVHIELAEDLQKQGVILTDLETAVRDYPDLVRLHFMTDCVPVESDKYTALHAAFWSGGFFLYVPKGVEIDDPFLTQVWIDEPGSASFAHTLIIADEQSSVRFVQELNSACESEQASLVQSVVEVYVKSAGRVEFSNMQDLGQNVWHICHKNAVHEKDASSTWVLADLGSKVMLSNVGVELLGDGTAGELVGVFFTDHDQRYAIKTLSHHNALNTNAETLVHGVLTDSSRVEFDGMIRIEPKAQYTASFLSDHTLLLSDECRAESIPGLEIGANEVSASHGATTGKIDEEQLFYLMVRGIPRDEAERIIVQGFFEPVLQRIPLESLRIRLRRSIIQRMSGSYENEADTWVDAQERWEIEDVDEYAISLDSSTANEEEIKLTEY
ncbi:MAG TPA: Fe-S cluster assembly protein SufD [Ktedonobacteraceae bacterium]|nr:Fe-S cluster assembly protein SufD [Ktedonobacteraceae bacterium]